MCRWLFLPVGNFIIQYVIRYDKQMIKEGGAIPLESSVLVSGMPSILKEIHFTSWNSVSQVLKWENYVYLDRSLCD